ncbi:Aspartate kinase FUB3 [Fusarium oxysporum f. sp. albedinis]|nr:Aspartate kinase FUB3 [Fusarium oxysporum f. sp. albedinis]
MVRWSPFIRTHRPLLCPSAIIDGVMEMNCVMSLYMTLSRHCSSASRCTDQLVSYLLVQSEALYTMVYMFSELGKLKCSSLRQLSDQ